MASHAVLQPDRVSAGRLLDGAAAPRATLHAVYNQYLRCSADPGYNAGGEAVQALLRPLFLTSFLIDDFLADNGFFGARRVLLSSASSKTAYGTAFCLSRRRGSPGAAQVIGLTSAAQRAFSKGLGCYDEVLPYDDLDALAGRRTCGVRRLLRQCRLARAVHRRFGDGWPTAARSAARTGTHWRRSGLPGPRPGCSSRRRRSRSACADWGPAGLQQRPRRAWQAFMRACHRRAAALAEGGARSGPRRRGRGLRRAARWSRSARGWPCAGACEPQDLAPTPAGRCALKRRRSADIQDTIPATSLSMDRPSTPFF